MQHTPESEASSLSQSILSDHELAESRPLILVVDDDVAVRESLAEVLRLERYAVTMASDGRDAVREFMQGPPDLILLDINMPQMNGWDAYQIVTQMYPFVAVIVITARPDQTQRASELGVDTLLEKPFQIPELISTITRLLSSPRKHREARISFDRPVDPPGNQG